jgi:DNA-binding NarL/FixJ family response regulator
MDLNMPGIGGIEGVKIIKALNPSLKVVIHTVFDDDNRIFDCICAGADGYLLKGTPAASFISSLQDLLNGGAAISPFVGQKVFQFFREHQQTSTEYNLTTRETEILEQLVKGLSYKMIARECYISVETVRKHLHNIYYKLQVHSGTEAISLAIKEKIVRL